MVLRQRAVIFLLRTVILEQGGYKEDGFRLGYIEDGFILGGRFISGGRL